MILFAHDDLWPLFYTGRCRAIPMPALSNQGPAIPFVGQGAVQGITGHRIEGIFINRVVLTTVALLTPQDAKDAGFLNLGELLTYMRHFDAAISEETPVFLAHFARVIQGEKA